MGGSIDRFLERAGERKDLPAQEPTRTVTVPAGAKRNLPAPITVTAPAPTTPTPPAAPPLSRREQAQAEVDEFFARQTIDGRLNLAVAESQRTGVGKAARIQSLVGRTGLPSQLIARNVELVEHEASRPNFDAAEFRRTSPFLAGWLAEDPNRAALLGMDLTAMGTVERQFASIAHARKRGQAMVDAAEVGEILLSGAPITAEQEKRLAGLESILESDNPFALDGFFAGVPAAMAEQVPLWMQTTTDAVVGTVVGGAVGAGIGAFMGPVGAATGMKMGAGWGAAVNGAARAARLEAALAFIEYRKTRDAAGDLLDPRLARGAAIITGVINGALEVLPMEAVAKNVPGVRALTRGGVRRMLGTAGIGDVVKRVAASVAEVAVTEGGTEFVQEMTTAVARELAVMEQDGTGTTATTAEYLERLFGGANLDQALSAARAGAQGGGGMGLAAGSVSAAFDWSRITRAERGAAALAQVTRTLDHIGATKAAPDAVREAVAAMAAAGADPDGKGWFDVTEWREFWQKRTDDQGNPIDPRMVAEELLGSAAEYDAAAETEGGVFAVPMADVLTTLGANPAIRPWLIGNVRMAPNEMSAAEAMRTRGDMDAVVGELLETARQELARGESVAATAKRVEQTIAQKAKASGVGRQEASAVAKLFGGFFRAAQASGDRPDVVLEAVQRLMIGSDAQLAERQRITTALDAEDAATPDDVAAYLTARDEGRGAAAAPTAERPEPAAESALTSVRTPSGTLRANLANVSANAIADEIGRLYDLIGAETPGMVALENEYGDVWTGTKDAFAAGRTAQRKRAVARLEAELAARGLDPVQAVVNRSRGLTAAGAEDQSGDASFDPSTFVDDLWQRAFHGTRHWFDRFTTAKMGTGEGAQAYGWGLYFAENEGVAEGYRKALSADPYPTGEQLAAYFTPGRVVEGYGGFDRVVKFNPETDTVGWSVEVRAVTKDPATGEFTDTPWERNRVHFTAPSMQQIERVLGPQPQGGALYRVDISDETVATFLDWDKPLDEQVPVVRKAIEAMQESEQVFRTRPAPDGKRTEIVSPTGDSMGFYDAAEVDEAIENFKSGYFGRGIGQRPLTGEDFYQRLTRAMEKPERAASWVSVSPDTDERAWSAQEAASKSLLAAGIRGIKFLDAGSRPTNAIPRVKADIADVKARIASLEDASDKAPEWKATQRAELTATLKRLEDYLAEYEAWPVTRNFVVFDENDITITHRNGEPVTAQERADVLAEGQQTLDQRPAREQVIGVAVRHRDTGKVTSREGFEGGHFGLAMDMAGELLGEDADLDVQAVEDTLDMEYERGFLTDRREFVSRDEALDIARAARQVSKQRAEGSDGLIAEDMQDVYEQRSAADRAERTGVLQRLAAMLREWQAAGAAAIGGTTVDRMVRADALAAWEQLAARGELDGMLASEADLVEALIAMRQAAIVTAAEMVQARDPLPPTPNLWAADRGEWLTQNKRTTIPRLGEMTVGDGPTGDPVPVAPSDFADEVTVVDLGKRKLPVSRVRNADELATAMAWLADEAVEHSYGLVTDAAGKPLALVGGTVGAVNSTIVYMPTVVGEALAVKGAAHLWLAHNHPSGEPSLSPDDMAIHHQFGALLRGSSLTYQGIMAVARNPESGLVYRRADRTNVIDAGAILPAKGRGITARVTGRRITRRNPGVRPRINGPNDAYNFAKQSVDGRRGIIVLSTQREPVGFIDVTEEEAQQLRTGGRIDRLMRLLSASVANGAIVVWGNEPTPSAGNKRTSENLAGFLMAAGYPVYDILDMTRPTSNEASHQNRVGTAFTNTFFQRNASLVLTHNLSVDNLRHALRMGGIPVPSLAVTAADRPLDRFGEITLVGSREMADPEGRFRTRVFGADIYSPRYPSVEFLVDRVTANRVRAILAPFGSTQELRFIGDADDLRHNPAFRRYAAAQLGVPVDEVAEDWRRLAEKLLREVDAPERIFRGFTPSGRRRYMAHTLENVARMLKKNMRGGESYKYGLGSVRARFAPEFRSVAAIQRAEGRLLSSDEFDAIKKEMDAEFFALSDALSLSLDQTIEVLEDTARMSAHRSVRRAFDDYRGGGAVDAAVVDRVTEFAAKLRTMPTEYFEAKITRVVGVEEFAAALVPAGTPRDVVEALARRGLTVEEYAPGQRAAAIARLSTERVLFQEGAPIFYSSLHRAVRGAKMAVQPAPQWLAWLKSNSAKLGIKKDEIEWSGVMDYLAAYGSRRVTRDELAEFVAQHGVKVESVEFSQGYTDDELRDEIDRVTDQWIEAYVRDHLNDMDEYDIDEEMEENDEGETVPTGRWILVKLTYDERDPMRYFSGPNAYGRAQQALEGEQADAVEQLEQNARENLDERDIEEDARTNLQMAVSNDTENVKYGENTYRLDNGEDYGELVLTVSGDRPAFIKVDGVDDVLRIAGPSYRAGHYFSTADLENVVAHVRFTTRRSADGRRVLFLEEVQSDWAQAGADVGFATPDQVEREAALTNAVAATRTAERLAEVEANSATARWLTALPDLERDILRRAAGVSSEVGMAWRVRDAVPTDGGATLIGSIPVPQAVADAAFAWRAAAADARAAEAAAQEITKKPPIGPIVTDTSAWVRLVMKRMIRYAADNNFEAIAWAPGAVHADRWKKAVQAKVKSIAWMKQKDGRIKIRAERVDNGEAITKEERPDEIRRIIGKDMADAITQSPDTEGELTGNDLTVGQLGFAAFYDRIVPEVVGGLLKELGGAAPAPLAMEASYPRQQEVPLGFPMTPALREKAQQGLAMFQPQEAGDPQGRIRMAPDLSRIQIERFNGANKSTFLHESAHLFLAMYKLMAADAGASARLREDFGGLMAWLGARDGEALTVEQEEQFARGFEAYLREGRAPSLELRSTFHRFAQWLKQIYKTLQALWSEAGMEITLTDEVRAIMDRMIATEEEIARAEAAQRRATLAFDGLTAEEQARYAEAVAATTAASEEILRTDLLRDVLAEDTARYRAARGPIETAVRNEVLAEPAYRALYALQRGQHPNGTPLPPSDPLRQKLSRKAVVELIGEDRAKALPRAPGPVYTREGGVDPDLVASAFGFESGLEMLEAMEAATERLEDRVKRLTDERTREAVGNPVDALEIPDKAMDAIHHAEQEKKARIEAELLGRAAMGEGARAEIRTPLRLASRQVMEERARAAVQQKAVRGLSAAPFQRAEMKAATAAARHAEGKRWREAFEAKQRELFALALYREVTAFQRRRKRHGKLLQQVFRSDERIAKSRDLNYVLAIRAMLAQYGIGGKTRDPAAILAPVAAYDPEAHAELTAAVQLEIPPRTDPRDLTVAEWDTLMDTAAALWTKARRDRQVEIDGEKVELDVVVDDLVADLDARAAHFADIGKTGAVTAGQQAAMALSGLVASARRVESWVDMMDHGDPSGRWRRTFFTPISEAADRYRLRYAAGMAQLKALAANRPGEAAVPIPAPELVTMGRDGTPKRYTFKDKAHLLGAMLHVGNASNKDKLLRGMGWSEEGWRTFVARLEAAGTLTAEDYALLQGVWDLFESIKPEAQRVHYAQHGYYFDEITAEAVSTRYGIFRGGYVPALPDPNVVEDAAIRQEARDADMGAAAALFPVTVQRGFTKSRTQQYARPLIMDLRLVSLHWDAVTKFVYLSQPVRDVGRVLRSPKLRTALGAVDHGAAQNLLAPFLERAAKQAISSPGGTGRGWKALDGAARYLRKMSGLQFMVANVVNTLQNVSGFSLAAIKVPPKRLSRALWRYVRDPKGTAAAVRELSPFMAGRTGTSVIEAAKVVDRLVLNPTKYQRAKDFADAHGYFLQSMTQGVLDVVVWQGAFDHALAGGASDREAVRVADSAVRLTQGSFAPEDLSRMETGTPVMRLFTMFWSWFNMQANLLGTSFANEIHAAGLRKATPRLLMVFALGFLVPAIVSESIYSLARGGEDDEDGDGYLDDYLQLYFMGSVRNATALVPVAGQVAQLGINQFDDRWYNDDLKMSPAMSTLEGFVRGATVAPWRAISSEEELRRRDVQDALTFLSIITHLPLAGAARPAGYLMDVQQGDAQPTGPVDFTRGILTGRP